MHDTCHYISARKTYYFDFIIYYTNLSGIDPLKASDVPALCLSTFRLKRRKTKEAPHAEKNHH